MEDDISRISLTTRKVFTTNSQIIPQPPLFKLIPTVAAIGLHPPSLDFHLSLPSSPTLDTQNNNNNNNSNQNTPLTTTTATTTTPLPLPQASSPSPPPSPTPITEQLPALATTTTEEKEQVEEIISSTSTSTSSTSSTSTPATSPSPSSPSSSATIITNSLLTTTTSDITTSDIVTSDIATSDITTSDITTVTTDSKNTDSKDKDSPVAIDLPTAASDNIAITSSYSDSIVTDPMPTLVEKLNNKHFSTTGTIELNETSKKIKLDPTTTNKVTSKTIITNKERTLGSSSPSPPPLPPVKRSSKLPLRKSVSTPLSRSVIPNESGLLKKPNVPKILKRESSLKTTTTPNVIRKTTTTKENSGGNGTKIPSPSTGTERTVIKKGNNEDDEDDEAPAPKPISLKEKRARQAKRQDQVKFWRVREEREARQKRLLERRMTTIGNNIESSSSTETVVIKKGVKFNLKRNRVIEIPVVVEDQTNA